MAFLGTPMQATPIEKRRRFIENWEPTFAAAAEAAFDETRQLFGLKPLSDLQELANIKGFTGPTAIYDMYSDDPFFEKQAPSSRLLEPDEANREYGIEGSLKFTEPVLEHEAKFRQRLKNEELQRAFTLEKNKGFLDNLGTFGVELIADITDPIGFASLLFPVTKLKTIAGLTKKFGKVTPYAVGGLEAAGSAVIPMTPGYFAAQEFDYSFTPGDYGVSLAGAAVLGGTLRKFFFQRELKDTEQLINDLHELNKQGKHDVKNQKQKSDDTVSGSASSKVEADTSTEARAENRKHSVLDAAYEIKDPTRIDAIHKYIKSAEHFKGDVQALETNLGNARSTLIDINKSLIEINDLLKSETNAKVSKELTDLRDLLEEYKKIGKATVERLEKEAKSNIVEHALTEEDLEPTTDGGTIEFGLLDINNKAKSARKRLKAGGGKSANREKGAIRTRLKILFPGFSKVPENKQKKIAASLVDKEKITLDDIQEAIVAHTKKGSDVQNELKEAILKANEKELSSRSIDYEEDLSQLDKENQAEAEDLLEHSTDADEYEKWNNELLEEMVNSGYYTNPETGELIPEFQKIIDDYADGKIRPDRLQVDLAEVARCLRGRE